VQFGNGRIGTFFFNSVESKRIQTLFPRRLKKDCRLVYRGADKTLARPERKQAAATEYLYFHIYPIYNHNWRNIITIYIYITFTLQCNWMCL
jgi:hypothetical protein